MTRAITPITLSYNGNAGKTERQLAHNCIVSLFCDQFSIVGLYIFLLIFRLFFLAGFYSGDLFVWNIVNGGI